MAQHINPEDPPASRALVVMPAHPHALESTLALRAVALYEAGKALIAIAIGVGVLLLLQGDVSSAVAEFLARVDVPPDSSFAKFVMHSTQRAEALGGRSFLALMLIYATVRLSVARGLWKQRAWGEWLGAASGAVYVPFEVDSLWRHPGWLPASLLLANLAIVLFLCARLWMRRRDALPPAH
jgi:uncharacterized membrane protein (DUF2068 family)